MKAKPTPHSMKCCAYCLAEDLRLTAEHIIARSWFPALTPSNQEKWQVPACEACNNAKSLVELRTLILLAYTIDPLNPGSAGIIQRAKNAMDEGRSRDERDRVSRRNLRGWFASQAFEVNESHLDHVLPHTTRNFSDGARIALHVEVALIDRLVEWWMKGFQAYLTGKPAGQSAELNVHHLNDIHTQQFEDILAFGKQLHCGQDIRIRYFMTEDAGELVSVFNFRIWNQISVYGDLTEQLISAT